MRIIYPGEAARLEKRPGPLLEKFRSPTKESSSGPASEWMIGLAATVLVIVLLDLGELNYSYYNFKGTDRPAAGFYNLLPDSLRTMTREAAKGWAFLWRTAPPLTTLPDHDMLCVPKSVVPIWDQAAPGSAEASFQQDVEDIARNVAKKYTKPGILYDENRDHAAGEEWLLYVEPSKLKQYQKGNIIPMPVDLRSYPPGETSLICGTTPGHNNGPDEYRAYAYTFEGKRILWRKEIHRYKQQ